MEDPILDRWFETVAKRLAPGGACYANTNITIESSRWLQFPFLKRSLDDYVSRAERHGLTTAVLGSMRDLGLRTQYEDGTNPMLQFTKRV
jgi:hypothetical protein